MHPSVSGDIPTVVQCASVQNKRSSAHHIDTLHASGPDLTRTLPRLVLETNVQGARVRRQFSWRSEHKAALFAAQRDFSNILLRSGGSNTVYQRVAG